MFVMAVIAIASNCKQPTCPTTDAWINKLRCIHTMAYNLATKRNELSIHEYMDEARNHDAEKCHTRVSPV